MNTGSSWPRLATFLLALGPVFLAPCDAALAQASEGQVRVVTTNANIHNGPSTNPVVLVLAPRGYVLTVIGRRGEWLNVRVPAELREIGMPMRWFRDEDEGWIHQSFVEFLNAAS